VDPVGATPPQGGKRGGGSHGRHHEETKRKISQAHLGMKASAETHAKLSAALKGNTRRLGIPTSEEVKHVISEKRKAQPKSKYLCYVNPDGSVTRTRVWESEVSTFLETHPGWQASFPEDIKKARRKALLTRRYQALRLQTQLRKQGIK
jgi:hypothetical protein